MSRKDAMYFARQAERRARHEPSAQVMDMRYHIDALEAKVERLEKMRADILALCAQEGNDGWPFDEICRIATEEHDG